MTTKILWADPRTKPATAQTVHVYAIRRIWRFYSVSWTDGLNWPRKYTLLAYGNPGAWMQGSAHPVGTMNDGISRSVHPVISAALDVFTATPTPATR